MADYTITATEQGYYEIALPPAQEKTIQIDGDLQEVRITNHSGTSIIYYTTNGKPATIRGKNTRQIPASPHIQEVTVYRDNPALIRVISEQASTISIARPLG